MSDDFNISKLFLLSGKDLKIANNLYVKHPIVQEIMDIDKEHNGILSESIYYSYVKVFLCDPYNYMVYLDDNGIDYESISSFELFIMLYQDLLNTYGEIPFEKNPYFRAFKFFLNIDKFKIGKDCDGKTVLGNIDTNEILINETIFSLVASFIKLIHGIGEFDRINPEDDFAKQILIEDARKELKRILNKKEDEDINWIGNLLSSATWGTNGSITPFNRCNLHIYDLTNGIEKTNKVFSFNHTMTGIYSGCIDRDKINMQKIAWNID